MTIKVLIADNHQIIRKGLCSLIQQEPDMEVLDTAGNGREAVKLVQRLKPDVVIMDISMPDMNGIEATRQIVAESNSAKVIGLSVHSNSRVISEMLKVGACGYLLKDCSFEELIQAIRGVMVGNAYLSPKIVNSVIEGHLDRMTGKDSSASSILTDRERDVLQLISEGVTTKQIASRLYISAKTVEKHRKHIMEKLGIRGIAGLTKFAINEGYTTIDAY